MISIILSLVELMLIWLFCYLNNKHIKELEKQKKELEKKYTKLFLENAKLKEQTEK